MLSTRGEAGGSGSVSGGLLFGSEDARRWRLRKRL
jgi:hypothetical protein